MKISRATAQRAAEGRGSAGAAGRHPLTAGRELRVLPPSGPGPGGSSALGAFTSIPWCCVVPAVLASLGLGSSVLGGWLGAGLPAFFAASLVFLGRAHYLIWVKGHGSPKARLVTLAVTGLAVSTWAFRLAPLVRGWVR